MDFELSASEKAFRDEVRGWLEPNKRKIINRSFKEIGRPAIA